MRKREVTKEEALAWYSEYQRQNAEAKYKPFGSTVEQRLRAKVIRLLNANDPRAEAAWNVLKRLQVMTGPIVKAA